MTSGFNIATNRTTNKRFDLMILFTPKEERNILKPFDNKDEIFKIMKENYNGYLFNRNINEKVFVDTLVIYILNHYTLKNKYPDNLIDVSIIPNYDKISSIINLSNNNIIFNI